MDLKDDRAKMALDYHAFPTPGKISVVPTKPLAKHQEQQRALIEQAFAAKLKSFSLIK